MNKDEDVLETTAVTVDTDLSSTRARARADTTGVRDISRIPRGSTLGNYVVGRRIGVGDAGAVYVARHNESGARAALKVLYQDRAASPRMVQWFTRELETLSRLQHPNIIDVYDIGQLGDGRPYYVTELLTGMSLTELLNIHSRLEPLAALDLFDPICYALQAAHGDGVVHGNLKSNNIMVVDDGAQRVVKVLDFALTRLTVADDESSGFLGSAEAAAPEQLRGLLATVRSDIYALGVLLFHSLTGECPFGGHDENAIIEAHLGSSPPLPSQLAPVSPAIDSLVLRCLEKDPNRRFDSVLSLQNALHRALDAQKQSALETPGAVIIYIRVQAAQATGDETVHNAMLREVMMFLDNTEDSLREAGFAIAGNVTDGIMGITALPADTDAAAQVRGHVLHTACLLYGELQERTMNSNQRIEVSVVLRIDDRITPATAGEVTVPKQVVKELPKWGTGANGVYARPEMFVGLVPEPPAANAPRGYVEVDFQDWS